MVYEALTWNKKKYTMTAACPKCFDQQSVAVHDAVFRDMHTVAPIKGYRTSSLKMLIMIFKSAALRFWQFFEIQVQRHFGQGWWKA